MICEGKFDGGKQTQHVDFWKGMHHTSMFEKEENSKSFTEVKTVMPFF